MLKKEKKKKPFIVFYDVDFLLRASLLEALELIRRIHLYKTINFLCRYILSRDRTNVIVMRTDNYLSVGIEETWENVEIV